MIFRPFLSGDKKRLSQFRCATRHDPDYQRLIGKMFRNGLVGALNDRSRNLRAFVAEDREGRLAGIVALEAFKDNWEVAAVGVSVDHRRQGIATALIKFGVANSAIRGDETVVFSVHQDNDPMHRLVASFSPERAPHPGIVSYDIYVCEPSAITRDLAAAMAKTRGSLDKDELRLGLSRDLS